MMSMKSALFWFITQGTPVIRYRRFETTYRSLFQGSRNPFEEGVGKLFQTSVRNYHYALRNIPEKCGSQLVFLFPIYVRSDSYMESYDWFVVLYGRKNCLTLNEEGRLRVQCLFIPFTICVLEFIYTNVINIHLVSQYLFKYNFSSTFQSRVSSSARILNTNKSDVTKNLKKYRLKSKEFSV
jgi:hypothetical protein